MESSFRAYRKLRRSRSWLRLGLVVHLQLHEKWVACETHSMRSPFGAEDKYFLTLARVEANAVAIVGLVKLLDEVYARAAKR